MTFYAEEINEANSQLESVEYKFKMVIEKLTHDLKNEKNNSVRRAIIKERQILQEAVELLDKKILATTDSLYIAEMQSLIEV
jgi:predicted nucleic acid-binding protein